MQLLAWTGSLIPPRWCIHGPSNPLKDLCFIAIIKTYIILCVLLMFERFIYLFVGLLFSCELLLQQNTTHTHRDGFRDKKLQINSKQNNR